MERVIYKPIFSINPLKKLLSLVLLSACFSGVYATAPAPKPTPVDTVSLQKAYLAYVDSVNATFHYQTGVVHLPQSLGDLTVPAGFKYLDAGQSKRLLTDVWGNPKEEAESLGMLLPADRGPAGDNSWAFVVEYESMGYVKDDDAESINYADLLEEMKKDAEEANKQRIEGGYEPVKLIGWASNPYYDKELNALHWAKELQFGNSTELTLNYNVRLLGRKGVLNLNAVGKTSQLPEIRQSIPGIIRSVTFAKGLRYTDFNPDLDEVAAYGIGGLVAGKVLAKVGFFAIILKFWKILLAAVAAGWTAIRRFFGGKTNDEKELQPALEGPADATEPEV